MLGAGLAVTAAAQPAPLPFKPDVTVAADGSGDFPTIQAAVASIPHDNRERKIIFVKDGTYREKVRVEANNVTLRGQSRAGTHLEFSQGLGEYRAATDKLGQAVLNIFGDDFVLENMVVQNTHGVIGTHAFAIFGRGDRTVIQDCDVLSQGNDTLSLWRTGTGQYSEDAGNHSNPDGRYYHARIKVCGSVDMICPRGWCYVIDSEFFEVNPKGTGGIWHDGCRNPDMKLVMRDCRFDGLENWVLARWHRDGQFFFVDCKFSKAMGPREPYQYPIAPLHTDRPPTAAEIALHDDYVVHNVWGKRVYFFNSHRDGGDYDWHRDNLASAPGSPQPEQITAKWTFAGKWDPESKTGPVVKNVRTSTDQAALTFSENVTVKGHPRLVLRNGSIADYSSGSGSDKLVFTTSTADIAGAKLDFNGGTVVASEAGATLRFASATLP